MRLIPIRGGASRSIPSPSEIEQRLGPLIGRSLWKAHRSLDLHAFHFGERLLRRRRDGERAEVGRFALHVQCAWRLVANGGVFVGSRDRFELDETWVIACDQKLERLVQLHRDSVAIAAVSATLAGAFQLAFDNGDLLQVFPDGSAGESWRLVENRPGGVSEHFVVTVDD